MKDLLTKREKEVLRAMIEADGPISCSKISERISGNITALSVSGYVTKIRAKLQGLVRICYATGTRGGVWVHPDDIEAAKKHAGKG